MRVASRNSKSSNESRLVCREWQGQEKCQVQCMSCVARACNTDAAMPYVDDGEWQRTRGRPGKMQGAPHGEEHEPLVRYSRKVGSVAAQIQRSEAGEVTGDAQARVIGYPKRPRQVQPCHRGAMLCRKAVDKFVPDRRVPPALRDPTRFQVPVEVVVRRGSRRETVDAERPLEVAFHGAPPLEVVGGGMGDVEGAEARAGGDEGVKVSTSELIVYLRVAGETQERGRLEGANALDLEGFESRASRGERHRLRCREMGEYAVCVGCVEA